MNAEKEVRIIVKNNDQVGKIIKWYQDNKQMLDAEKFVIPFQSGSIILPGEIVSFEAKQYGLIELCLQIKNGKKVLMWDYDPATGTISNHRFPANMNHVQRKKMIDVMESDYMLFATARGESKKTMVISHGLRNIALPAMTLQFASIREIIGGSVLVEQVFSYPGLGQAAVAAGTGSDVPLLLGITVVTAAVVFAGNFLANVLYGLIDPRMRKRGRKL